MSDLIDRQKVIDVLNKHSVMFEFHLPHEFHEVKEEIRGLPSAQPTQTNTPNVLKSLDCISRQAAIEALKSCAGVGNRALDKLRAQPTADAVEVVRCKDCKHFHGDGLECRWGMYAYEDDYCSNGERKEADG